MLPGPQMIFIPGGTLNLRKEDRTLKIKIEDIYIDETPVTVAQYREAVNAGAVSVPFRHEQSNWGAEDRDDHPINCVSYYQAEAYAEWAGKRLLTAEEWTWAAWGGDEGRMYPWGGAEHPPRDQLCWNGPGNDLGEGNRKSTSPVGSYPKGDSKHGLKDMVGNVREWLSTNFRPYSKDRPSLVGGCYRSVWPADITNIVIPWSLNNNVDNGFRCAKTAYQK